MAALVSRYWPAAPGAGASRADRRGCDYRAFVPDALSGREIVLDGSVVADVTDAEAAVARFNFEAQALNDYETLARLLLRAEAVASSRIEGLEIGGRRLLREEAADLMGEGTTDVTASEVLGNIRAMQWAVAGAAERERLQVADLLEIHRRLLDGTSRERFAGRIRDVQNWIGGSSFNPCSAVFVPPPPEFVPDLLEDLCAFASADELPAVVQAAIAHAQFETIHPFVDGNGRTGRALIHVILRRRGLAPRVVPPVSLVLATWSQDYIDGLTRTRVAAEPESEVARAGLNRWVALFAAALRRAIDDAEAYEAQVEELQEVWSRRLGRVRGGSATERLLRRLPAMPILTVTGAAAAIQRSFLATNRAVERLVAAGVLEQVRVGRRNRAFEAREVIDAFTDLERRLASPDGDTHVSEPARRVPRRRA